MPLLILVFLIADLLSIASPFIAYLLYREWDLYNNTIDDAYADRCLYGAIAMLLYTLLGKFPIKALLSQRRKGEDGPQMFEAPKRDLIPRPDGSKINVEYYGRDDAQPIVFVHGLNASIKNWYYQRKYFEKNYRLIMMDLPGMGKSTRPSDKDYSLTNLAASLQAVIKHSGAKSPILWGHSLGGMTILTFLANNRDTDTSAIKGVILEHTTYTNPVRTIIFRRLITAIQKPVLVPLCWIMVALSPLIWVIRWMGYLNGSAHIITRFLMFAGTQTPRQLDFITRISVMTPTAVMARGCLGMFRYDVTPDLDNITVPTLVIAANKDLLTQPDASEFMKQHIPNAELVTVVPGNHQGLLERHAEVNEAAALFIDRLSKQSN